LCSIIHIKTKTMELKEAIKMIENHNNEKVVMIEFEDGSGYKFNYRLKGESKSRFIDFQTNEFFYQFMEAKKIMDNWFKSSTDEDFQEIKKLVDNLKKD